MGEAKRLIIELDECGWSSIAVLIVRSASVPWPVAARMNEKNSFASAEFGSIAHACAASATADWPSFR